METTMNKSEVFERKQFDLSMFNAYLNDFCSPDDLLFHLMELKAEYLELSLYAQEGFRIDNKDTVERRFFAHENIHKHIYYLGCIIDVLKSLAGIQI